MTRQFLQVGGALCRQVGQRKRAKDICSSETTLLEGFHSEDRPQSKAMLISVDVLLFKSLPPQQKHKTVK